MASITQLPSEILNINIGQYLSDVDWQSVRCTCRALRDVFIVNKQQGAVIYNSNPIIGDRSSKYIQWRSIPTSELVSKFSELADRHQFILELIQNRACRTLIRILSHDLVQSETIRFIAQSISPDTILDLMLQRAYSILVKILPHITDWDQVVTYLETTNYSICKIFIQRFIYLCSEEIHIVNGYKERIYNVAMYQIKFIDQDDNLGSDKQCITLIENGFDVNTMFDDRTVLYLACRQGRENIVRSLLKYGANVNLTNKFNSSPLYVATYFDYINIVKMLIEYGADVNNINVASSSALISASYRNYIDIIEILLKHGANINHVDKGGNTSLLIASKYGNLAAVQILLKHDANIRHVNKDNRNAYFIALESGFTKIAVAIADCQFN